MIGLNNVKIWYLIELLLSSCIILIFVGLYFFADYNLFHIEDDPNNQVAEEQKQPEEEGKKKKKNKKDKLKDREFFETYGNIKDGYLRDCDAKEIIDI